MKRISRAQLRGQRLDPLCKIARTTTNEYGSDDRRVFCHGVYDAMTEEPEDLCLSCGAFVRNETPPAADGRPLRAHKFKVGDRVQIHATPSSSADCKTHDGEIVTIKALCPFTWAYELEELPNLWHENCLRTASSGAP